MLAAGAGAALVTLLVLRTGSQEISGIVRAAPGKVIQRIGAPIAPGRKVLQLTTSITDSMIEAFEKRALAAGFSYNASSWKKEGETTADWIFEFQIPEEAASTVELGDLAVVDGRALQLQEGKQLKCIRYYFRRGSRTWSAGEASNWKFLAAYGLAGGGPLLLWAVGCGVVLLRRRLTGASV